MFISFIFGLIFGIVGGWFLLFYLILKFGNKSLDKTNIRLSKINEENKEFMIKKSMSKAKSMSQKLIIQFAGKKKTRAEYQVSLGMYKLEFVATRLNNNPMDRGFAELAGCTIRLIGNKDSKLPKAIEILNPINKIFLNFDYLFLIFESSKDQINWYNDLSLVCTETQMESISNFSLERDMNKLLSYQQPTHFAKKGWAQIQAAENAKGRVWRYCLLENHILHHFGSKDISKTDMKRINLIDCDIFVNEEKKRFKITSKKREILETAEYIYFITTHERHDFTDWKDALSSIPEHAKYYEETPLFRVHTSSSMATFPQAISLPNIPSEVIYNTRESATWLNMIIERFMRNIKFSEALNNTIKEKIQKKLEEKVTMKGLNNIVSNIKVEKFYISSKLPTIIWAKPIKSKIEDKIMVDFMINLNCREDPIIIGIAATITPFKKHFAEKKFGTHLELKMNSLLGKLHFECMPFPASRFSLSFYEEPSIDIKVCSSVSLPDKIKNMVEELLVKKMKVSLLEKFLMPNRKYFPIPKSQELSEKYLKKVMESTTLDDEIEIEQDDKTQVSEDFDFEDDDDSNPPSMDVSEDTVFMENKKNN